MASGRKMEKRKISKYYVDDVHICNISELVKDDCITLLSEQSNRT